MRPDQQPLDEITEVLRGFALSYFEAHEEFPWGDRVVKVRNKTFLFIGGMGLTVKLPYSHLAALTLPLVSPTGYGLGKAGWVSAELPSGTSADLDFLKEWVDESYRAVAPKTLVAKPPH